MSSPLATTTVTLVGIGLLGVTILAVLEGFVLIEMVRQVAQLRHRLNLDDRPMFASLGEQAGQPVPDFAANRLGLDRVAAATIVLFLSTDCTTCQLVATELESVRASLSGMPTVTAVVEGRSGRDVGEFLRESGLADDGVVRDDGELGNRLGLRTRPLAVAVRDGIFTEAAIVRNGSQLRRFASQITIQSAEVTPADHDADPHLLSITKNRDEVVQ